MPWTVKDVEEHKKGLTPEQKKQWVKIANAVLEDCQKEGKSDCDGKAIRIANSKFSEDVMEWTDEDLRKHNEYFGVTEDRKKPGGSNVGKYKKGPFCGPSGGAPKGTYPVDTEKRAIAAIAYARHAPNPAGIKKCVCSHWPKLDACKKKKEKQSLTVPKDAFHFRDTDCFAKVITDDEEEQLDMVVYSGGIILDHWYWGNLAIDLEGLSFPKKKFPILEDHQTDKKIAFTNKPIINGNLRIDPSKVTFVDTEASQEFRRLSKEGFPYESSMFAQPTSIERIEKAESAEVNGIKLTGPGTVWRKAIFKEASVCVFGYDSNTHSQTFKDDTLEITTEVCSTFEEELNIKQREVKNMDINELKEKHPELFQEITDNVREKLTTELTGKFNQEKKDLEDKNKDLEGKLKDQSKKNESLGDKVLSLEKAETIRSENDLRRDAKDIWAEKLAESDIPKDMYGKVSNQVSYRKHLKDGILDKEAFTTAIKGEIEDWEKKGVTDTVIGSGFSTKDVETEETKNLKLEEKADDDLADNLFELSGGKKEEVK